MKYKILFTFASIGILSSCTSTKEEQAKEKPAIAYEMKTFSVQSQNCAQDSARCATYEVQYPVFTGVDTTVLNTIQHKIDSVLSAGYTEGPLLTIEQLGRSFIEQYEEFVNGEPEAPGMGWYRRAIVSVAVATDSLIVLSLSNEDYSGGAHPNSSVTFVNIDPHTGRNIGLGRFLKPGYEATLTSLSEQAFRKARELPDTASFSNNFFDFPNDKFALNDNFGFTPEGIVFYYNSYEVAPYAAGPTEVIIPYSALKDWLK